MFKDFLISELRTLSYNETPSVLSKNLISNACTCDRILSVIILRLMNMNIDKDGDENSLEN